MADTPLTFRKEERICGKKSISALLAEGRYAAEGALRFCSMPSKGEKSRIMVSVPKKMFRRAVKRNLMKRRIREAYRHQKSILEGAASDIMFIYNSKEPLPYDTVYTQVGNILRRVADKTRRHKEKSEAEHQSITVTTENNQE